jgi:hypothetical protein
MFTAAMARKKVKRALVNVFHTGADVKEINC